MKPRTRREKQLISEGLRKLEEAILLEGKPNNTIGGGLGELFTLWFAVKGPNQMPGSLNALKTWCTSFGTEGTAVWGKSSKKGTDTSFIADFLAGGPDTSVQQRDARINAQGIRQHYGGNPPSNHGFKGGTTGKGSNQGDIFFDSDMWSVKVGGSQAGQSSPGFGPINAHKAQARISTTDLCVAVVSAFTGLSIADVSSYDYIQVAGRNVSIPNGKYKAETKSRGEYLFLPYNAGMSSYVNPVLQAFLVNLLGFNNAAKLQVIDDVLDILDLTGPNATNPFMADPKTLKKYIAGIIPNVMRTSQYYQDLLDFEAVGKPVNDVHIYTEAGSTTAYMVWHDGSEKKVLCKVKLRRGDNKGAIANLKFDCTPNGFDEETLTPAALPSGYTAVASQTLTMSADISGNSYTIAL